MVRVEFSRREPVLNQHEKIQYDTPAGLHETTPIRELIVELSPPDWKLRVSDNPEVALNFRTKPRMLDVADEFVRLSCREDAGWRRDEWAHSPLFIWCKFLPEYGR